MSYVKHLELPRVGEPVESARVVHWHIQPGEQFSEGDVLLEIDTDKAVLEVPAEEPGKLLEQLVATDDLIDGTTHIAKVEVEGEPPAASREPEARNEAEAEAEVSVPDIASSTGVDTASDSGRHVHAEQQQTSEPVLDREDTDNESPRIFATPVARRLAAERDLALDSVVGHGPRGRVTRADIVRTSQDVAKQTPRARGPSQPIVDEYPITTAHGELFTRTWSPGPDETAPTIVLIHGIFADIDAWQGTARSACRRGYRVVAMDLPCHGRSRSGATQFTDVVEAVAEAIARVCTGPVVLVGHSFGAAVAARTARKPDLQIDSLMLIAPVGLGTDINQAFITGMTHAGSIAALEREMRKLTTSGATPSGEYLYTLRDRLESQSSALALLGREVSWGGVQQLDISSDLAALECPITIVHGRSDSIVPWEHALNAPARVALHLVPGVGHMPQWEATALIGELLERTGTTF